jgi:hypothetical protein
LCYCRYSYSADQLEYHYTKSKAVLARAVNTLQQQQQQQRQRQNKEEEEKQEGGSTNVQQKWA